MMAVWRDDINFGAVIEPNTVCIVFRKISEIADEQKLFRKINPDEVI